VQPVSHTSSAGLYAEQDTFIDYTNRFFFRGKFKTVFLQTEQSVQSILYVKESNREA